MMRTTHVCAFSGPSSGGNLATVVEHEGVVLSRDRMQSLAREHGTPATVFVDRCSGADRTMRFFAVAIELPFCAHGLLAASEILMERLGTSRLSVQVRENVMEVVRERDLIILRLSGYQSQACADKEWVLAALRMTAADIAPDRPFLLASAGSWGASCRLPTRCVYRPCGQISLRSEPGAWSLEFGINGVYAYALSTEYPLYVTARGLNPRSGQDEDAASGVGAAALVLALAPPVDTGRWILVEQGVVLGSRNQMYVQYVSPSEVLLAGRVRPGTANDGGPHV